jgi:hypothetical protein
MDISTATPVKQHGDGDEHHHGKGECWKNVSCRPRKPR